MKIKLLLAIIFILSSTIFSQTYESKWGFGVGASYPRFFSVSGTGYSANDNYGGYISLQRHFTEYLSLRLLGNFSHLKSNYYNQSGDLNIHSVNHISGNLDAIYYFNPCENFTPFFSFGIGITNFTNDNSFNPLLDENFWGYQMNLSLGVEWLLSDAFALKTEATYRHASNNKIDGNDRINENSKGIFGGNGDTYMNFDAGLIWYFGFGDESDLCDKCPEGVREVLVRDTVFIKEPVIETRVDTVYKTKPILFNVHFEFDKYTLRPESMTILEHSIDVLKEYPELEINISGHTDSYGTNDYNIALSKRRVDAVYNYLVEHGINSSRITRDYFGEDKPVRDNQTDLNRAFNRRVEFKILER